MSRSGLGVAGSRPGNNLRVGTQLADAPALGGRREERKAQNREKLLAAARRVFAAKGLGEATARDIVRETDLATGTFYNYFDSKEDVFRALLGQLAEKARRAVRRQRAVPGVSLEQRVHGAYRAYFELAVQDAELFGDVFEWSGRGELPEADLDYLAAAMVGTGFQVATHLVDREPPDVDGATRFCTRIFMGGVRALAEA